MPILTAQERLGSLVAGRYRVQRVLAIGGMSVLFEARDERARRAVALKLLRAEDCVEDRKRARFLQEVRLTAELRHPHVVDVLDLGEDQDGTPYLVMELMHGRSLQAELDEHGTLGFERSLSLILPIMEALGVVHAAGVVHRDVKPDNIFLQHEPRRPVRPKLLDFGIAKAARATLTTRTGAVLGTPHYMAPEQLLSSVVGPSADIWAIGAVLYRMLSGQTPFHAETSAEVIAKLTRDPAPPLHVPGLAPSICTAIDRALSRDPIGRYPDMHAFATALVLCARENGLEVAHEPALPQAAYAERLLPERTLTAPSQHITVPPTPRRSHWLVAGAAGLALALAWNAWPSVSPPKATPPAATANDEPAAAPTALITAAAPVPAAAPATPPIEVASTPRTQASWTTATPSTTATTQGEPSQPARKSLAREDRKRRKLAAGVANGPDAGVAEPAHFAPAKVPGQLPVAVQW